MDPVKRRIRHVQRLAESAQPLKEFGEAGPGRGKRVPGKAPTTKGASNEYWLGRLARDRPDILEEMKQGKYRSVKAAVVAAGWLKQQTTVDRMRKLWQKATERERQAFAVEVMGWLLSQDDVVYDALLGKAETLSEG
jgi:hypothetical protein